MIGNRESNNSQPATLKHRHLVELVLDRMTFNEEERQVIFSLVSSVDQTQSKWVNSHFALYISKIYKGTPE